MKVPSKILVLEQVFVVELHSPLFFIENIIYFLLFYFIEVFNKAKAISAKLLEFNLKKKLEETGK